MSNVLTEQQQHDIRALGRLGWSLPQIERRTGVRREPISDYLKAAGIPVRTRGAARAWPPPNPATTPGASTDSPSNPATTAGVSTDPAAASPTRAPSTSACEIYREVITDALGRGRNAMAIWQDLVDDHGFTARYASVRRFVARLRGTTAPEARVVILTPPGVEGQVDCGDGPMVRWPETGQYRRTRKRRFASLGTVADDIEMDIRRPAGLSDRSQTRRARRIGRSDADPRPARVPWPTDSGSRTREPPPQSQPPRGAVRAVSAGGSVLIRDWKRARWRYLMRRVEAGATGRQFQIVIENAGNNFSAYSPDLPGCVATGRTHDETKRRMYAAIQMHTEGLLAIEAQRRCRMTSGDR